jgi:hypothetical protein
VDVILLSPSEILLGKEIAVLGRCNKKRDTKIFNTFAEL